MAVEVLCMEDDMLLVWRYSWLTAEDLCSLQPELNLGQCKEFPVSARYEHKLDQQLDLLASGALPSEI